MSEQFGDKTQEATPHRREKAREEGHVAHSQDLSSAAILVVGLAALLYLGPQLVEFLAGYTRRCLSETPWPRLNSQDVVAEFYGVALQLMPLVLPILGVLLAASFAAHWFQVGFLFLPQKLGLDLNRLNPLSGLQRIFSLASVMRLTFGLFKIVLVAVVAGWSLWGEVNRILLLPTLEVRPIAATIVEIALWSSLKVGSALFVLAVLDYFFQWWKHEQDLRMSTQEIREEMKELQGDPQTMARRRVIQRQLVMNRVKNQVPKADVVVTNPTELAIALQYDPETMAAPVVVAKGAGVLAQRIRRLALESDIPIVERKELARFLYKNVELNQAIPVEQYAAVAEVLRYVYELKGKTMPQLAGVRQ